MSYSTTLTPPLGTDPSRSPIINCYDRVKVVASVSWSFDPYTSGGYQYSGKTDGFIKRGAMIPTLQQLINKTTWSTELCSTTKVEVQNER